MRIASGIARGISLDSPRGDATRPATDAARLAIFSSLGETVVRSSVLDLFAGTGAYGFEALSRGAISASFVESGRNALACLRENAKKIEKSIGAGNVKIDIRAADCFKCASVFAERKFDLIFADPPYAMLEEKQTLAKILALFCSVAVPETLVVLEAPAQFELPENFETDGNSFAFDILKRLGKKSKGKPSQIIFSIKKQCSTSTNS